jgi:hypothetical protein
VKADSVDTDNTDIIAVRNFNSTSISENVLIPTVVQESVDSFKGSLYIYVYKVLYKNDVKM